MAGFFPNFQGCAKWDSIGGLCSGNGICQDLNGTQVLTPFLPNTQCICKPYWTGHGLFISQINQDCSTYFPWIMALSGLNCLLELFFLYLQTKKMYEIITQHKRVKEVARQQVANHNAPEASSVYSIGVRDSKALERESKAMERADSWRAVFKNRPVLIFILLNLPWDVGNLIMCLCMVLQIYPGDSPEATFPYIISILSANLSGLYYQKMVIRLSISMAQISRDKKKKLNFAARPKCFGRTECYLPVLCIILSCFIILGFYGPSRMQLAHILVSIPYFLSVLCCFIGGYETYIVLNVATEVLSETNRFSSSFALEGRRSEAIKRIHEIKNLIFSSWTVGALVIYGLPTVWPYFRTRQIYVWLLAVPLTSSSAIQKAMSFSSTGRTWSANDTLEIFLYIVDKKFDDFLAFLKTEYSGENLLFWRRIEEYRTTDDPEGEIAKGIYLDFINPSTATQSINLPSEIMYELQEWFSNITSCDPSDVALAMDRKTLKQLFLPAQREIFQLICNDSLPRFRNTSMYQAFMEAYETQKFFVESGSSNGTPSNGTKTNSSIRGAEETKNNTGPNQPQASPMIQMTEPRPHPPLIPQPSLVSQQTTIVMMEEEGQTTIEEDAQTTIAIGDEENPPPATPSFIGDNPNPEVESERFSLLVLKNS